MVLHLQMKVSSNVYAIRASRQPPRIQLNRHEAVGENVLENFKSKNVAKRSTLQKYKGYNNGANYGILSFFKPIKPECEAFVALPHRRRAGCQIVSRCSVHANLIVINKIFSTGFNLERSA